MKALKTTSVTKPKKNWKAETKVKNICTYCGTAFEAESKGIVCKFCNSTFVKERDKTFSLKNYKFHKLPKGSKGMSFKEMVDARIFIPEDDEK